MRNGKKVFTFTFNVNDKEHGTGNINVIIDKNMIPVFVDDNDTDLLREHLLMVLNNLGDNTYTKIK